MRRHLLAASLSVALASPAWAADPPREDLGKIGPTYQIAEDNLLEWIEQKLVDMEETGELERKKEEAKRQAIESVENPEPNNLPTLAYDAVQTHDPSIMATRDITDGQGNVIVPKGTTVNPLDQIPMTREMLFFDGRDPRQVAWAKRRFEDAKRRGKVPKPILVAGSYLDLMREWGERVYYDQGGYLLKKLGIGAVPVRVYQKTPDDRVLTLEYTGLDRAGGPNPADRKEDG